MTEQEKEYTSEELILYRACGQYLNDKNLKKAFKLLTAKQKEGHGNISVNLLVTPFAPYNNVSVNSMLELIDNEQRGLKDFLEKYQRVKAQEVSKVNITVEEIFSLAREIRKPITVAQAGEVHKKLLKEFDPAKGISRSRIEDLLMALK